MLRVRPTALGAKGTLFFAVVSVLFFATPYSNLFFLLLTFLGALAAVGVVGAWRNLRALSAEVMAPAPVAAGAPCLLSVLLRLPVRQRCFCIDVAVAFDDGTKCVVGSAPVATDGVRVDGHVAELPRGAHPIAGLLLSSQHPFGICNFERRLPVAGLELIVHPRPTDAGGARNARGAGAMPLDPGAEQLAGLRPFRAGDAPAAIHWKATARRGAPIVKEREQGVGDEVLVVVDRRADDATLEQALSAATARVFAAWAATRPVRLCSQDCELVHRDDEPQRSPMLRWLATASALPDSAPPPRAPVARHEASR